MAPPMIEEFVSVTPPTIYVMVTSQPADMINDTVTDDAIAINNFTVNFYFKLCWSLIGALGIMGNIIVIVPILANPVARRRLTNLLVINQCFTDFTAALCLLMMAVVDQGLMTFTKDKVIDEVICRVWFSGAIVWGALMASGYGTVFLSIERYIAIVYPLQYATKFTRSKAVFGIVAIWIVGYAYNLAFFIPSTVIVNGVCLSIWYWPSKLSQRCVFALTFVLQYAVPICCLAATYSSMYYVLHRRTMVGSGRDVGITRHRSCDRFRRRLSESLMVLKRLFKCYKYRVCLRESQLVETLSSVSQTVSCVSITETAKPEMKVDFQLRPSVKIDPYLRSSRSSKSTVGAGPKTRSEKSHAHPSPEPVTPNAKTKKFLTAYDKAKRNLFKTIAAVSISFVLCWTPNQLLFLLSSFGVKNLYGHFYDLTVMLILLQCFINPFIYAAKYKDFKTSIKLLIHRKKKSQTESTASCVTTH